MYRKKKYSKYIKKTKYRPNGISRRSKKIKKSKRSSRTFNAKVKKVLLRNFEVKIQEVNANYAVPAVRNNTGMVNFPGNALINMVIG